MTIQITLETEICIAGPITLASLKSWLPIQGISPKRQQLNAVYFDTEKFDLAKCRAGLRLRRESGVWVQTLKTEVSGGVRQEWTHRHPRRPAADLPPINSLGLPHHASDQQRCSKPLLQALSKPENLEPKFSVQVRRTTWLFKQGNSTIELAMDLGSIQASNQQHAVVQEVELELKSGLPKDLWLALRNLLDHLGPGYQIEPRSKAQRGYGLWHSRFITPSKSKVELGKGSSAREIVGAHLRSAVSDLTQWLQLIHLSDDPEGTHQARVCLRRIRTVLKLLRLIDPSPTLLQLSTRSGQLAAALGELRNLDVTEERFWRPLTTVLPNDLELQKATQLIRRTLTNKRASVRRDLLMPETGRLICDLQLFVDQISLPEFAGDPPLKIGDYLLARLQKRLKKLTELSKTEEAARHRLRLAYKAMRYATPILRDLGVKARLDQLSKQAAKAQEKLGDDQDRAVALETIERALLAQEAEPALLGYSLAVTKGFLAAQP